MQVTKLGVNSTLKEFTGYATVRRDRPTGGGGEGLVALVYHFIPYTVPDGDILPDDDAVEVLAVETDLGGTTLTFVNVYIPLGPPAHGTTPQTLMVLGDFNAHHPSCFSRIGDDRAAASGEAFDGAVNSSQLAVANQYLPTRLPSQGQPSSPDITLLSGHLLPDVTWSTLTNLGSDHLPITISVSSHACPHRGNHVLSRTSARPTGRDSPSSPWNQAAAPRHSAALPPGSPRPMEVPAGILRPRYQSRALLDSSAQAGRQEVESPT